MDIQNFLQEWIDASNNFDTENYLNKYHQNATLDDPSVGRKFSGRAGIEKYFNDYFIGYNTHTKLLQLTISGVKAHMIVEFTGSFPEGRIKGYFDFAFKDQKIAKVKAGLL